MREERYCSVLTHHLISIVPVNYLDTHVFLSYLLTENALIIQLNYICKFSVTMSYFGFEKKIKSKVQSN